MSLITRSSALYSPNRIFRQLVQFMSQVLPYFYFLALTIIFFSISSSIRKGENVSIFNPALILTFLTMVLFAGLRSADVGTDTWSYVLIYKYKNIGAIDIFNQDSLTKEPGFTLIQKTALSISPNYWALLVMVAVICYSLILYSIIKQSKNRVLSLFFFITLGYYTFCFNAARQAVAISIYLLAIPYILKKEFWKYSLIVLIAALFHRSVLIAIPLYFIFRQKYSGKSLLLLSIISIIVALILPYLIDVASEINVKYNLYKKTTATGGYLLTLFYVLLSIFFIYMRKNIPKVDKRKYDIYLQMLICGSIIYLIVILTGRYIELCRCAAYFQISSIFLVALLFNKRNGMASRQLLVPIVISCLIYYYIYLVRFANLVPYTLNPTI